MPVPDFSGEITFQTTRSSGAGGQNVNKVETAVRAKWNVQSSEFFREWQKSRIGQKLASRMDSAGCLSVFVQDSRSQLENKKIAIERLFSLVEQALFVPKVRKKTKATKGSKERRLQKKKENSQKKQSRREKF